MNKENVFDFLSRIDCSKHTKKKSNLTYLSWSWAWAIVKTHYPTTTYEVVKYEGKPYLHDSDLGYMVHTIVTINNEKQEMYLPVMDGANNAQKNVKYSYEVAEWVGGKRTGKMIEKWVLPATMFDINTAIMRCLVKNLALFGLGHYIYAGEDLPRLADPVAEIDNIKTIDELKDLYNEYSEYFPANSDSLKKLSEKRKKIEESNV